MSNTSFGKGVRIENMIITVAMARDWLTKNDINRPKRPGWIEFLAAIIKLQGWTMTNDSIVFDEDGNLLNGQHRLLAIVMANMPVRAMVAFNMPRESYKNTDIGVRRSQADNLGLPKELVTDAKLIAMKLGQGAMQGRVTNQAVEDIVDWYKPIFETFGSICNDDYRSRGNNVGSRLGFGLRYAVSAKAERQYVMMQFNAFIKSDTPKMSRCVAAAWRRSVEGKEFGFSKAGRYALMNFLFHATAYSRREREPLIRNAKALDSETTQWLEMTKDAYLAGPAPDGHLYLYTSKPVVQRELTGAAAEKVKNAKPENRANL